MHAPPVKQLNSDIPSQAGDLRRQRFETASPQIVILGTGENPMNQLCCWLGVEETTSSPFQVHILIVSKIQ